MQNLKLNALITQKKIVFLFIFFACAVFFIQFPLHNSLVGDIDTIYNLALYHQMKNFIDLHLFGIETGLLCAPTDLSFSQQAWMNFGANYGIGIFHVFLNYLGFNDLWAHWMFMTILFTLNCFSLYLVSTILFKNKFVSLAVALIFNYAHFTLGNIDNINSVVFFFSYFAIYSYLCYIKSLIDKSNNKLFYIAVFLGAIQIYLSPYNFVIHTIIWSIFIFNFEIRQLKISNIKRFTVGIIIYALVISPYMYMFFISGDVTRGQNEFITKNFIHVQSLNFDDLFRVLKNHLYLKSEVMLENPLLSKLRAAYLGIGFYVLVILGLFIKKNRNLAIALVIIGFVIAIGPFISINNMRKFPSFIMHPVYEWLNLYDMISVPIRFFFVALLGLCFLAGNGLLFIYQKTGKVIIPFLFVFVVLLENIPIGMEKYNHKFILQPEQEVASLLKNGTNELIYYMPSSLYEINYNYRREYIYTYWQHFHRQNIVNCFPPFMPPNRKKIDKNLENFNATTLNKVITENGFDKIVFSKSLVNSQTEANQLDSLYAFPYLIPIFESEKTIIFEIKNANL